VAEGQALVRKCLGWNQPGPYQIQAAIQAVHSDAATAADTDWPQILALYDQLLVFMPTPMVRLNRAVALAEIQGPEAGLHAITGLDLDRSHLFHAIRADFLHRLDRYDEAIAAYNQALAREPNGAERAFLERAIERTRRAHRGS
jgi:RNA polymerase sigma-70 factor (ECF subfamily)